MNDPDDSPTLAEERPPTQEEVGRVVRGADLDVKVAISILAQSGVLGSYDGTDGLRVGDILDMKVDNETKKVTFTTIPALVRVRKRLSKAGRQYLTLIGMEAARNLAEYLERRMKAGEHLTATSSILRPAHVRKPFIRTTNVSDKIRKAVRAAGYPWRSYIFRIFFATQLQQAESKGLVIRAYAKFWMGHHGDMLRRYTLDKQRLTDEMVKDLRDAYGRCQGYLETEPAGKEREDVRVQFRKQLMIVAGYTDEEVEAMDLGVLNDEELQQKLRERLFGVLANNGHKQRVVPVSDVARYISEGWEFVAKLDESQAIVRLPD